MHSPLGEALKEMAVTLMLVEGKGRWGYFAGNALQRASGKIDLAIVAVAVLVIAGVLFFVRRQISRLGVLAEAAYPGPLSDR